MILVRDQFNVLGLIVGRVGWSVVLTTTVRYKIITIRASSSSFARHH